MLTLEIKILKFLKQENTTWFMSTLKFRPNVTRHEMVYGHRMSPQNESTERIHRTNPQNEVWTIPTLACFSLFCTYRRFCVYDIKALLMPNLSIDCNKSSFWFALCWIKLSLLYTSIFAITSRARKVFLYNAIHSRCKNQAVGQYIKKTLFRALQKY